MVPEADVIPMISRRRDVEPVKNRSEDGVLNQLATGTDAGSCQRFTVQLQLRRGNSSAAVTSVSIHNCI
jgi:hypothetical protein